MTGVASGIISLLNSGTLSAQQAATALANTGVLTDTVTPIVETPTGSNTGSTGSTGSNTGSSGEFYLLTGYGSVFTSNNVALKTGWTGTPDALKNILSPIFYSATPVDFRDALIRHGISAPALDFLFNWTKGTAASWATTNNLPAFAEGGSYQGGVALVGERGPELINFNKPGQVYTASQTNNILNSGNDSLVKEIRALREEVSNLRYEARATATNTAKMTKQLDRASGENDVLRVEVVA